MSENILIDVYIHQTQLSLFLFNWEREPLVCERGKATRKAINASHTFLPRAQLDPLFLNLFKFQTLTKLSLSQHKACLRDFNEFKARFEADVKAKGKSNELEQRHLLVVRKSGTLKLNTISRPKLSVSLLRPSRLRESEFPSTQYQRTDHFKLLSATTWRCC